MRQLGGWIGDAMPDAGVGRSGLGALARLRSNRSYECYREGEPIVVARVPGYTAISII